MHAGSHISGPSKITWTLGQPQMFQWKAHNHVLIRSHAPSNLAPFYQLDPLIKNYMKTNALSTIFTRYGKPNVDEASNYRYPKVIMDISNWIIDIYNWIMDISIPNCICVIMDIHDSIIDAHISVMDYPP